jgi:hypothetical protein
MPQFTMSSFLCFVVLVCCGCNDGLGAKGDYLMTINICKVEKSQLVQNVPVVKYDSNIYELARTDQIFSSNEVAKFEIASELRLQGVTIEAISRMLSIPQEELFAEFDS